MARPTASVIISAKNEAGQIEACLRSLALQKGMPFEVLVVDNDSTDHTFSVAKKLIEENGWKHMEVLRQKKPGSPAARNFGAKKAKGEILIFTDADCTFAKNWVQEMAAPLLEEGPMAALGGVTQSAFAKEKPNLWERYLHELFLFWEEDRLADFPAFLPWAPTCNLSVQREIFFALGGFDENWKSAAYDVDFCWRLVLCGFLLGHNPEAVLYHRRRNSLRGLMGQMENYSYFNASLLRTYQKALGLSAFSAAKERALGKARRLQSVLSRTKNFRDFSLRAVDILASGAHFKGAIRGKLFGKRPDPKLQQSRTGKFQPLELLPMPYRFLHNEGWCYWKAPPDTASEGDLILYNPITNERFRLNESAWKIWEVKAMGGQAEDAAEKLGQSRSNKEVLRDIDSITLDLRSRGLLP